MRKKIKTLAFFDSGQGGLTIWSSVCHRFPRLKTVYLGDNARYPFGTKSSGTVKRYTTEAILTLSESGADAIVVACGTASSVAVPAIQPLFALPILGIVDGMATQALKAFRSLTLKEGESATIATLATPFTVKSGRFEHTIRKLMEAEGSSASGHSDAQPSHKHHAIACPLLVALVEEGFHDHPMTTQAVDHYLTSLPTDTRIILLGCTHFPRLAPVISRVAAKITGRPVQVYDPSTRQDPEAVLLIDPGQAVTQTLSTHFDLEDLAYSPVTPSPQDHKVYCTDDPEGFERTARYFCGDLLPTVEKKVISL